MRTRTLRISEGGLPYFHRPEGFLFAFEENRTWRPVMGEQTFFAHLEFFVHAWPYDNPEDMRRGAEKLILRAIREIEDPDEGLLTVIHRGPYEMGLTWSENHFRPKSDHGWEERRVRPKWWTTLV